MPEERSVLKHLLGASMVGLNLVISTFVGLAIGYFLDKFLGTKPWLTLIFLLLGIVSGFRDLIRIAINESKKDEDG